MKFNREVHTGVNLIRAWAPGRLRINERVVESSVVVSANTLHTDWGVQCVEEITLESLQPALDTGADIVVIGTGAEQRFPDLQMIAALQSRGIGVEIMATDAAARTYNVLVGEGRNVVAVMLMR